MSLTNQTNREKYPGLFDLLESIEDEHADLESLPDFEGDKESVAETLETLTALAVQIQSHLASLNDTEIDPDQRERMIELGDRIRDEAADAKSDTIDILESAAETALDADRESYAFRRLIDESEEVIDKLRKTRRERDELAESLQKSESSEVLSMFSA